MTRTKPKILCVDDESGVLDALERLLKKDFEVLRAPDVDAAESLILHHQDLAIILTDYRMPGKTGIELLRYARTHLPHAARAILSGQMDMNDLTQAINKAEVHRFILKPWENEYLKVQMLEALQMHNTLVEKKELRRLAITDPVTGLTNHRYFQDRLREELGQAALSNKDLSVIMIDVDHFKSFNDRYGHPEGDRLLAEIGSQIESLVPKEGSLSRYGGEEFALLLPGHNLSDSLKVADYIRSQIEEHPFHGPHKHRAYITVSLGVATFLQHGKSPTELIQAADNALYKAKGQGRNRAVSA